MSEIKVHLTVIASDGRMMTKSEARKAEVNNGNGFITTRTKVFNPKNNKLINIRVRANKETRRSLNISKEAYFYMTSTDGCPEDIKLSTWKNLNKMQRLDIHMQQICQTLGGSKYDFYVLED